MKKLLFLFLSVLIITCEARADEGMWLPSLLGNKYKDMVAKGLKMTPDMIYDINNGSLKDAVVQFGGGCTGEIISKEGLLITNHHCGYGSIAAVSTVAKNYLQNGFWSKNMKEEIPIPGLTVKFLVEMQDVTDEVLSKIGSMERKPGDEVFDEAYLKAITPIKNRFEESGKYVVDVKPLYNGNQYFMWKYIIYTDIRLVATPPESLGKFGGDTDNWMWPRHTADFSMFRVYADANNKPATYNAGNKPFVPAHVLPVNISGYQKNDYMMTVGYPGNTNRYETSYGVTTSVNFINPSIVKLRGKRLEIMRNEMQKNAEVRLKMASRYAQIANYWKYFIGQTEQLERFHVVEKKKEEEAAFIAWAKKNKYKNAEGIFPQFLQNEKLYRAVVKPYYYYNEGLFAPAASVSAYTFVKMKDDITKSNDTAASEKAKQNFLRAYRQFMSTYNANIDEKTFAAVNLMTFEDVDKQYIPAGVYDLAKMNGEKEEDFAKSAKEIYSTTIFTDTNAVMNALKSNNFDVFYNDPMYKYALGLKDVYENQVKTKVLDCRETDENLAQKYLGGLLKKNGAANMYPDANSTMRLSYGTVQPYKPKDAVSYDYFTTLEGVIEKYKPKDLEFDVPLEIIELWKKKDYGRYADADGTLHTDFLTTNDITGGNSGSPVLNGKGELMGLAFDGNWEAMCGDIYFDKNYKRTIVVDIRYVLWLIEKYGKAPNIVREMDVVDRVVDGKEDK